ncbi:MAG: FAD-dependent oxidoreductase [Oscillospiraceae bacterium]
MFRINETLECDVFVAGGGIAGLSAAIAAADKGANVIVGEKANTIRSGNGATGNDHFQCYVPEVFGTSENYLKNLIEVAQEMRGLHDMDWIKVYAEESWDRCKEWEEWGIPMRPHGTWEYAGHHAPGQMGVHLKYAGQTQKPVLTKQALKRGVKILNHHPFVDLITDDEGAICGAICLDLSQDEPGLQVVRCKSVVLASGRTARIYNCMGGMGLFNMASCPASGGEGMVAAYEAGARLVNVENNGRGMGIKFMHRGGKSTWVGLYTDIEGNPVVKYDKFPGWEYGDYAADNDPTIFPEARKKGEPLFMNFKNNSDYDIEFTRWGLEHEGNAGTLDHLDDEGFDFRKHMIQFDRHLAQADQAIQGIDCNTKAETTVKGLYASGQEIGNAIGGISFAAVSGNIAGRNAAEYSRSKVNIDAENDPKVRAYAEHCEKLLSGEAGTGAPDWKEIQQALGWTMNEYCNTDGTSEHLIEVGEKHLERIVKKSETVHCEDGHELMRALEVEKMLKLAKLVLTSSKERRESNRKHKRIDYPEADHKYDGMFMTIQKVDGKPVTGLRPAVKLEEVR